MSRVLLVHWNAAEAEERAGRLRSAGYEAEVHATPADGVAFRSTRDRPPDAFVIDLARLPSHGRAVAIWARQQKATRHSPIVFVGGVPEKVAATRHLLPDAVFTEWPQIRSALRGAIRNPPATPVVPQTMQEYSGTPLPKKLGIRAGAMVALLGAPPHFDRTLGALPEGVRLKNHARDGAELILLFVKSQADLKERFQAAAGSMAERGGLWIVWPKKASGVASDLTQQTVREIGLAAGLVDYKICAIDETWSGLLFARRRAVKKGA